MKPELKLLIAEFGNANFDYGEGESGDPESEFRRVELSREALVEHLDARARALEDIETRMLAIQQDYLRFHDQKNSRDWLLSRLKQHLIHTTETRA